MIVTTESTAVNNSGFSSSDFSMKHSAHAFKILTTSLYQNKEKAVLREYFANGYDAIIESGKTDPVRIQLPTEMEPNLVFIDNGVGMDKSTLTRLYSTFFDSTKQANNEAVGGFGLGSKSAFSLSDTFTVTSVKNNQSTTIVAYIDGGVPKLVVTNESATTEPSGTIVTIPVANKDVQYRLRQEARDLFIHSPIFPIVTLGTTTPVTLREKPDYILYNDSMYFSDSFSTFGDVVVGLFTYKIPESLKNRITDFPEFTPLYNSFEKTTTADCLNFVLPLGAIELSPSRETIEDTPANATVLFEIVKTTLNKYLAEVASFTPTVYKFLSEFIVADLSTYEKYQSKLKELTDVVPKPILNAIDRQLYHTSYKTNPTITAIHKALEHPHWLRMDSDHSLTRLNNIFNYNKWWNSLPNSNLDPRKLTYRGGKMQALSCTIEAPNPTIYVTNTKGANLTRYLNSRGDVVTYEGTDIPVTNIYAIEDPAHYDLVVKRFVNHVVEIPSTYFNVKATRKPTTSSARTPKSELKIFDVEFDSTGTYSGTLTTDFYSETLPLNTRVVVLAYSVSPNTASWSNIPALVYSPAPVLVLRELRSGETKTKRFLSFVEPYQLNSLRSDARPGNCSFTTDYFEPAKDYWKQFFLLVTTLSRPSIDYKEPTIPLSKPALYRFLSTKTEMKYYKLLLPKVTYRAIFSYIWDTYSLDNSIYHIIGDLLRGNLSTHINVGLDHLRPSSKLNTAGCVPLQILASNYWGTNSYYEWVLSQPTTISEIKAHINPLLGV